MINKIISKFIIIIIIILLCIYCNPYKEKEYIIAKYIWLPVNIKTLANLNKQNYLKDTICRIINNKEAFTVFTECVKKKNYTIEGPKWIYKIYNDTSLNSLLLDNVNFSDTSYLKYSTSKKLIISNDTFIVRKYLSYRKSQKGFLDLYWCNKYGTLLISGLNKKYMLYDIGNTFENYKIFAINEFIIKTQDKW